MRDFLRFLFPIADQAIITASTIVATDTAYAISPAANAPYPQSLQLTFAVTGTAPQVLPLFPGRLRFVVDPAAPGVLPAPGDVTAATYLLWKTRGTLMVQIEDAKVTKELVTVTNSVEYPDHPVVRADRHHAGLSVHNAGNGPSQGRHRDADR